VAFQDARAAVACWPWSTWTKPCSSVRRAVPLTELRAPRLAVMDTAAGVHGGPTRRSFLGMYNCTSHSPDLKDRTPSAPRKVVSLLMDQHGNIQVKDTPGSARRPCFAAPSPCAPAPCTGCPDTWRVAEMQCTCPAHARRPNDTPPSRETSVAAAAHHPCGRTSSVMSCSCHVMSCHVMSCHVMSCHVMSC
jgi:hypothetical protein